MKSTHLPGLGVLIHHEEADALELKAVVDFGILHRLLY